MEHAPDSSELYENISRKISGGDKPDLMEAYLAKYCELMGINRDEVLRWLPVQAGMLYGYKEGDICAFLEPYLPA